MPNTIRLKSSGTAAATPTSLAFGELAVNYADGKLFYKNPAGSIVEFAFGGTANVADGDKGDIVVTNGGTTWSLDTGVVSSFARTLLDDADAAAARTTLGAVSSSDSRLTDSRTPTAHKASHATGGTDALTPSDIGAASASHTHTSASITDFSTAVAAASPEEVVEFLTPADFPATGNSSLLYISTDSGRAFRWVGSQYAEVGPSTVFLATHAHPSTDISDATVAGRALITAADAAAQRTSLGLGTMATETAANYLPRSGGLSNAMTGPLIFSGYGGPHIRNSQNMSCGITIQDGTISFKDGNGIDVLYSNGSSLYTSIEGLSGSGTYPHYACRAWVNFNATAASDLTGTYSRSGTTVTVTVAGHNVYTGQRVSLNFTSGGISGSAIYTVASVISTDTFTVTHGTSGTTSGNVTLQRRTIRAGGNVSSVTRHSIGDYTINFPLAMPDANYAAVVTIGGTPGAFLVRTFEDGTSRTVGTIRIGCVTPTQASVDPAQVNVAIFR